MKKQFFISIFIFFSVVSQLSAEVIFSDDFQDGNFDGWFVSGNGAAATTNLYAGNYSLRLRKQKSIEQIFSTENYANVSISTSIAAYSLEGNDQCITEVSTDNANSWQPINRVRNGQDDGFTLYTTSASPAGVDNNSAVNIRLKSSSNRNSDYCYFDDIVIVGEPIPNPPSCDYDCLNGNGNVNRTELSFTTLQTTGDNRLVDLSAFELPSNASNPSNVFEGSLIFTGLVRGWSKVKDTYNYAAINNAKKLPDFNYQFLQHGTHLIPVNRGLQETSHNLWQLILEPGRVWNEVGDNGFSRASLPFSLQESGANCTHNGVMSFLYKSDGSISSIAYEIASETCEYYQFNLYGLLSASYLPSININAATIKSDYQVEVANRIVTKPISDLAIDFPASAINIGAIASEQTNLTLFGVSYNGIHYAGGCETRYGRYPYCHVLSLPSYSLAKSVFTGFGMMAIEQSYPGSKNLSVASLIPSCPDARWSDVTLENALDMATGNYTSSGFKIDEGSAAMSSGFFLNNTDSGKTNFACDYSRQGAPNSNWVYHSSDSYLIAKSFDQILSQDSYSWLLDNLYRPLGVSPVMGETIRTSDNANQSMGGYGLTFHRDDIIKLAELINSDGGQIEGQQKLDLTMVNEALQKTNYHGLNAGSYYDWYDNGFWIWKADVALNCDNELFIPYMSGFGGISVILLPNNMVYYFFSDNNEHSFTNSVIELNKIGSFCN